MSRQLRIEFPGALYRVTSRGDRREAIYRDDDDRRLHLGVIGQAMERFSAQVWAYCLMGNHCHLVLQTSQANLSRLMRHVNGAYTQAFNRRHGLVGHLFQGRFKAIVVDGDAYLLTLCRYVERNPVAAGLVGDAGQWPWSSYRAHAGLVPPPPWLGTDALHAQLLGRPVATRAHRREAARRYALHVDAADAQAAGEAPSPSAGLWQSTLRHQIFMGDDAFVRRMQQEAAAPARQQTEIPRPQRREPPAQPASLKDSLAGGMPRDEAIRASYCELGMTMTAIARELGLSVSRVSRVIARGEAEGKTPAPV